MLVNLNLHEMWGENNIFEKCKYLQVVSLFLSFNSLTVQTCQGKFFPVLVMKNKNKLHWLLCNLFTCLHFNFSVHLI